MEETSQNDSQLAKWLSGELSKEEEHRLRESGDLDGLQEIVDEVDSWEVPELDIQASYERLEKKRGTEANEARVIPFYKIITGIAASIALILVAWFGFQWNTGDLEKYATIPGEHLEIQFPDGSTAHLGPKTTISFDQSSWNDSPQVTIEGQAYFQGPHAAGFTVNWPKGSVKVIGTNFEVLTASDFSVVKCYSGTIISQLNGQDLELNRGEGIWASDTEIKKIAVDGESPTWLTGKYFFKEAPLAQVIMAMEREFDITIDSSQININRSYTGVFQSGDLNNALTMVFTPLNISYSKQGETVTLTE